MEDSLMGIKGLGEWWWLVIEPEAGVVVEHQAVQVGGTIDGGFVN
jgi:hypothetical protein